MTLLAQLLFVAATVFVLLLLVDLATKREPAATRTKARRVARIVAAAAVLIWLLQVLLSRGSV